MSRSIVILGAGVVGLCTALECARRGMRVTVVDRMPRNRDGCSFGNAGMVVPSHFIPLAAPGMVSLGLRWMLNPESPFYIRPRLDGDLLAWGLRFWRAATPSRVVAAEPVLRDLGLLSRACFEEIALDIGLVKKGLLLLCKEPRTLEEEGHAAAKAIALGIPAEVLDAKAVSALDPAVTVDVTGAVHYPLDCHLSPERLMKAMEEALLRLGVDFLWETEVREFDTGSSALKSALTNRGEIPGGDFVLSAGVWSSYLAKALRLNLPMQGGKGYSLTLTNPPQLPDLCSICTEARVAVTPMDGRLRFGGTMELAGLDESVSSRRVTGIVRAATRYFPAFSESDFEGIKAWSGLRPVSPDGLPYLGRTGRWKNLIIATGHAMTGLSLAPATGRIVADLVEGRVPSPGLGLLSPDRFG